jgi:hypothetical protein
MIQKAEGARYAWKIRHVPFSFFVREFVLMRHEEEGAYDTALLHVRCEQFVGSNSSGRETLLVNILADRR